MNSLLPALRAVTARADVHLEDYLEILSHAGKPRIAQFDDKKWYCNCQMVVTKAGAFYEVKSEFTHDTPISAAKQCLERVVSALEQ